MLDASTLPNTATPQPLNERLAGFFPVLPLLWLHTKAAGTRVSPASHNDTPFYADISVTQAPSTEETHRRNGCAAAPLPRASIRQTHNRTRGAGANG